MYTTHRDIVSPLLPRTITAEHGQGPRYTNSDAKPPSQAYVSKMLDLSSGLAVAW